MEFERFGVFWMMVFGSLSAHKVCFLFLVPWLPFFFFFWFATQSINLANIEPATEIVYKFKCSNCDFFIQL